jgi:hypothetical protein
VRHERAASGRNLWTGAHPIRVWPGVATRWPGLDDQALERPTLAVQGAAALDVTAQQMRSP